MGWAFTTRFTAARWEQKCKPFAYMMGESVFLKLFQNDAGDGDGIDESATRLMMRASSHVKIDAL
jgi:hypothetical protein